MEDLLPYYERELAFLRQRAREFAERYPKIAARLQLNGEVCDDPHVERMIESCALLSARVTKRLEDSYPQFTEALLDALYPHYLRPFPSCAIACFEPGPAGVAGERALPRGSELCTRPVQGVSCRFRTAWQVDLTPLRVGGLRFEGAPTWPPGVVMPAGCAALLSLRLDGGGASASGFARALRLYIDAEPSLAAALRDAFFLRVLCAYAVGADGRWHALHDTLVGAVGFEDDEALIDLPANAHPAYRHLTEYFAFPEKYNFLDLHLERLPEAVRHGPTLTLHFALDGPRADGDAGRLLQTLGPGMLRSGCVPVVNLFRQRGEPIRLTHQRTHYPVVADARKPHAYEVHSIDAVRRVRRGADGESVTELRPFFSLHHGETPQAEGHYWHVERKLQAGARNAGHEFEIAIVDADFDLYRAQSDVLGLELVCTNRDLPIRLAIGLPGGDLFVDGGGAGPVVRLLRKPSAPCRFDHRGSGQWRLISHLTLNQLSLSGNGAQALRELLALYDLPHSPVSRRQIDGIVAVDQAPATAWLPGRPFPCFVRGIEVRVTVAEPSLVGSGVDVFARVLDRFFGLYVHLNSFVQLVLLSAADGRELVRCAPRAGVSLLG